MAENQESIGNLTQNVALGPLFLWSDFLLMVVVRMMESLRLSGKFERVQGTSEK